MSRNWGGCLELGGMSYIIGSMSRNRECLVTGVCLVMGGLCLIIQGVYLIIVHMSCNGACSRVDLCTVHSNIATF